MKKISNPYEGIHSFGKWLRGNLHTHTTKSDGKDTFQEMLNVYADKGYQFLMISDHDIYTSGEEYQSYDSRGMTLVPGNEVTKNGEHILHVNADRLIEPDADRAKVLDGISQARGFAVVAHPNWQKRFDHCSITKLETWQKYLGLEIYNGSTGRGPGSCYSVDKWDILLSQGRRVWGFANDDSHNKEGDVALGWNMVFSKDSSLDSILEAIKAGRFYASTGVTIKNIEVTGNRIKVETDKAQRIVALEQNGRRMATADSSSIELEVPESSSYLRFECWGPGESFAWTQPFFISA